MPGAGVKWRRGLLRSTFQNSTVSVLTSAQYANFLTIDGRRFGHIIDPMR
jgi:thiamine biosynthesis lipoprotein ApbE